MINFASSIWLWALAGIIVPVLIHLWNVRKGKTLKIGSISFFTETPVSRARSLRLTDLLQLIIRCLLFTLLTLFIAQPFLLMRLSSRDKGWVVIERSSLGLAYKQYGKEIDSMLSTGMELHEFGGAFGEMKMSDSTGASTDSISYWALLRQLQTKLPGGLPVTLYAENQLARFNGPRPELAMDLTWKILKSEQVDEWIEKAYQTYDDSIVAVIGNSEPITITFNQVVLSNSAPGYNSDASTLTYAGDTILVDTASMKVLIYSDAGTDDAKYLAAAIDAAKAFTKRKIDINIVRESDGPLSGDWLFWLSASKLPGNIQVKKVFSYASGKVLNSSTQFSVDNELIPIYKLIKDSAVNVDASDWTTGSGDLIMARQEGKPDYVFYSRFDPRWNSLVWSPKFPTFVVDLLFPSSKQNGKDLRIIDERQLLPIVKAAGQMKAAGVRKDISKWFWIFGLVLFLVERLIAYRKQKLADG